MLARLLPEDELCLLLARGTILNDFYVQELLAGTLNWGMVLNRAEEHQISPLIYRSLQALDFPGVPDDVRAKLIDSFRFNAVRSMLFVAELTRLLDLLGEAGIRVIPLKGVALSQLLYGDPAFRTCSDIDILVPPADALRARRLLLAHGYTSPFGEDFFLKHQFRSSADCPLQMEKGGLSYFLELHWTLRQHSSRDEGAVQDLWGQARSQDYFGAPGYGLSPEWEFLYLAGHAAYHKWQTLKWLADINDLCNTVSIDWNAVQDIAERFDLTVLAGSTLAVCSELLCTPLPAGFPAVAVPAGVPLFPHSLDPEEAWSAPLFYPQLLPRFSEKLRWFAEMFFVARMADRMAFHLPDSLDFLYFILRPIRLTAKWSRLFLVAGLHRLRRPFGSSGN